MSSDNTGKRRHTATCGHKVDSGISCSVDDGQIFSDGTKATTYGTYCGKCLYGFLMEGLIRNPEMDEFVRLVKGDK